MMAGLMPIGPVAELILDDVRSSMREYFHLETASMAPVIEPESAFDARRGQYSSFLLMRELAQAARPPHAVRILGITECDLFIPMLTFVFGQAQFEGETAIVSVARLRQEFYGLPPDPDALRERLRKEVAHELGHTFGLIHCSDFACLMSLANTILHVDRKQHRFCSRCRPSLERHISEVRKTHDQVTLAHPGR